MDLVIAVVRLLRFDDYLVLDATDPAAGCRDALKWHIYLLEDRLAELCLTCSLLR